MQGHMDPWSINSRKWHWGWGNKRTMRADSFWNLLECRLGASEMAPGSRRRRPPYSGRKGAHRCCWGCARERQSAPTPTTPAWLVPAHTVLGSTLSWPNVREPLQEISCALECDCAEAQWIQLCNLFYFLLTRFRGLHSELLQ